MKLIDILTSPWAIRPDKLNEIKTIVESHLRGPKLNLSDIEARILSYTDEPVNEHGYEVINGNAVIRISGSLSKHTSAFTRIFFSSSSYIDIQNAVSQAAEDPNIETIILLIDSPGGTVSGVQNTADVIYAAREKKKIIAIAEDLMASAAYWLGSQAHEVYVSNDTTDVGSIGVLMVHTDWSKMDKEYGLTITEIFSGKYKTVGSPNKPLSDNDKGVLQAELDYLYSIFIDAVARGRGVDADTVLNNMADGKIFIGQQAITSGLVDGVATLDQIINTDTHITVYSGDEVVDEFDVKKSENKEADNMTAEELKEKYPDVYSSIFKLGEAEAAVDTQGKIEAAYKEGEEAGKKIGAEAERARIQGVEAHMLAGHEKLIASLKYDGQTTPDQAAAQIVKAEKDKQSDALKRLEGDAPDPVDTDEPPVGEGEQDDDEKPVEEQAEVAWKKDKDLRAEFGNNKDSFIAYFKANKEGRARILGGGK